MLERNLQNPAWYINRELSQLRFNTRVLAQAQDPSTPLLERLRFLFICSSNLDEFFEIRVAGLKEQERLGTGNVGADGLSPVDILKQISEEAHDLSRQIYHEYHMVLLPELNHQGIHIIPQTAWSPALTKWLDQYFHQEMLPVLSPIALDLAHPFPRLVNKSLNFIVSLTGKDAFGRDSGLAVVHVPRSLPRVLKIPPALMSDGLNFVLLTEMLSAFSNKLFPGMKVTGAHQFRLTRNSDLYVEEEEIDDLALALTSRLHSRHYGKVSRLEIAANCPDNLVEFLLKKHHLNFLDLYYCTGPVNLHRYVAILDEIDRPDLRYPNFTPYTPPALVDQKNIFSVLQKQDLLLHHPYQPFSIVVNFIHQATADPHVLAIKQTLYRTRVNSRMVQALVEAAQVGKEVTAVIELRARFDESSNIELANRLQKAGVLVVYGVIGVKTHAKMTLIVRREGNYLKRYVHLSTGNYHENTALQYTDFSLLTYDFDMTHDVQSLFQLLTGMGEATQLKKVVPSPFTLMDTLLAYIKTEIKNAKKKLPARIIFKVNGLTDPKIIAALYEASQAGVKIDLIVRTSCSLRPGIKGISENITVRSIVSRFLEHSRIYYFCHGGEDKVFCASADLMERNLRRRVEVAFPITSPELAKRVIEEGLLWYLQDNMSSWRLSSDGNYVRNKPNTSKPFNVQQVLLEKYTKLSG